MVDMNTCDKCGCKENTFDLIWIDIEDFEPNKDDDYNPQKHQDAVEILGYSALCEDCYKEECCGDYEIEDSE